MQGLMNNRVTFIKEIWKEFVDSSKETPSEYIYTDFFWSLLMVY